LNTNLSESGLKINIYADPTGEINYDLIQSGEDLSPSSSNTPNDINSINQLFSNSFALPTDNGDFRDIITLPKRTRWYNNMIELKNSGKTTTTTPYSSQDLNNQKKL
jgi:hypothetical protein